MLSQGRVPETPLLAVSLFADYKMFGDRPPPGFYDLPAYVVDEFRWLVQHVRLPEERAAQRQQTRLRSVETG